MFAKLNNGVSYTDKDIEGLTWQEKTKLVQKDPVTCSRYFDHRVQEFLNTILKSKCEPIGKLRDLFYRVEFQQRCSPHIHMIVWIENAPTLEKNSEEEIVEFVDKYLTGRANDDETAHLVELQTHKHSRTCRKKGKAICRFGFPLPPLPRTMLLYPLEEDVDQFKKKHAELQRAMNENKDNNVSFAEFLETVAKMMLVWIDNAPSLEKNSEEEIVQFVDKYLTCSVNYNENCTSCGTSNTQTCRFGFPLPPLPQTRLLYLLEEEVDQFKKKYSELQRAMNENKDNDVSFAEFLETVAKMTFEDYIKCIRSSLNAPTVFL